MKLVHIAIVSALLPLAGCVAEGVPEDAEDVAEVEAMLAALPTAEMLTLHYPGLETAGRPSLARSIEAQASCEASQDEETAEFYRNGCGVASYVNGVVNDVLGMVSDITAHDPSRTTDNGWMWGPVETDDGATHIFLMQPAEEGGLNYALRGLPADSGDTEDFITMIAGNIEEGVSLTQNVGDFQISYDNIATVHPEKEVAGLAYYLYDRLDTQTGVEARMENLLTGDGQTHNVVVDYDVNDDNSGTLRYGLQDDIFQPDDQPEDTTAQELAKVNTRWLSTGAGRSDVTVTEGDLGDTTAYRTQCWDMSYLAVFNAFYNDGNETFYMEGDSSQCVFEEPVFL